MNQPKSVESASWSRRARESLQETAALLQEVAEHHADSISTAATTLTECYRSGGKVLVFGNGGSASDALHIQGELMNRFLFDRPGLPCLALVAGSSLVTAISNDYSYETLFSRQIEALGQPGDVAIGLSTSGRSPNVLAGVKAAKEREMTSIGFTGVAGNQLAELADVALCVPSTSTPRIQEAHIAIAHILCELVEAAIFKPADQPS